MSNKIISFSYTGFPIIDPSIGRVINEIFRPIVPIRISYGHHLSRQFDALVDSGSDRNLFPASIGEAIGVNFKKIKPIFITGIGSIQIKAYPIKVTLFLGSNAYTTEADFCFEQRLPLLGRNGFFSLFKGLKFKEKEQFLDIYL